MTSLLKQPGLNKENTMIFHGNIKYSMYTKAELTIELYENIGYTEKARLLKEFLNFYKIQTGLQEMKATAPTMYRVYKAVAEHKQTTNEIKTTAKVCQKTAENYLKLLTSLGFTKCEKVEWKGRHKYMFMWSVA